MKSVNIKGLYKSFDKVNAVDNFSLEVNEGEIFGLLGPNGAGKSTVINIICSLVSKDNGEVNILGFDLDKNKNDIKKNIGIVPQEIAIFDNMTAYENVKFFGTLYGISNKELPNKIDETLKLVGLSDTGNKIAKKFSGGMKRRLNIACGIVHTPKLIILDEPTVAIDPQSRNHILNSVKYLNKLGSTIIYTTHYMEEAEAICNRISIMDKGKSIACGTTNELKSIIDSYNHFEILVDNSELIIDEEILKIKGIESVSVNENLIKIKARREISCTNDLILMLMNKGIHLININTLEPSLEDVFLSLTGKKLRD